MKKCFIIQYTFEKILNSHPPLNTCYDENIKIASHKSPPDKKIFSFGGASSHDISGGILEPDDPEFKKKKKELDKGWKPYRINHISWWEQELPSEEEMEEGRRNLQKNGNKVDFIVTHCCAASTLVFVGQRSYQQDKLNSYFEELHQKVKFQKWFFGHYHDNRNVNAQEILLYEQIIRIS